MWLNSNHATDKKVRIRFGALLFAILSVSVACGSLRVSRPLVPMREYEKMLVGSLFADYVGNEKCLEACHYHDETSAFLEESVHGHQRVEGTDMPLVNCESCHGPGSEAITQDYIDEHSHCNTSELIRLNTLPPEVLSMQCLKCHGSYSMDNMQYWPTSDHALAGVSCSNCHKLHKSSRQKLTGEQISDICLKCHTRIRSRFSLVSRHPVLEGKMQCVNCHDPHGSQTARGLKAIDIKGLCINCHGQFIGPFTFEHSDVIDDCTVCHRSHGSIFADMLKYQEPFLCMRCHTGHTDFSTPSSPPVGVKRAFYTRCTNCHSQIHGTDSRGPHPGSGLTQ